MPEIASQSLAEKLSKRSKRHFYNVYEYFDWTQPMPENAFWLDPSLLSTYGTPYHEVGSDRLKLLSKWETINLFSVFCAGEADLIDEIASRMHHPDLEGYFEYLIHFIDEENKHMWFFRRFCETYAGKSYKVNKMNFGGAVTGKMGNFLAFMKIVLFEEFGDIFNTSVIKSKVVPKVVAEIHRVHNKDEVGHILAGREIGSSLFKSISASGGEDVGKALNYLIKYLKYVIESMYNQEAYKDAGFADPFGMRTGLMEHPERIKIQQAIMNRILSHYPTIFTGVPT
jgi:para-aminobenzoate N-oxygenase AurF